MTLLGDRYLLGEPLGRSAGATVHSATDRTLQRPVAVTVVPRAAQAPPEATVTRAHTAAALSHPNLVTVLDAGETGDGAFVVTDRVEGATLADRLADAPLTAGEAVTMLDAVLAALEGLHGHGLVAGGVAPWQVRLGVDGMWSLAVLPAADGDAAPLPLGGPIPEPEPAGEAGGAAPDEAGDAAPDETSDLRAVGRLMVASLTGGPALPDAEAAEASLAAIEEPGLRALAADALAADALAATPEAGDATRAAALRRRLPGGAPAGLPATVGLPAPGAGARADDRSRPTRRRLRRVARALTTGGWR